MPTLTYISVGKFFSKIIDAFQNYVPRSELEPSSKDNFNDSELLPPRVQISIHDLKIISSALLHFKKSLLKKQDMDRAQIVSEVDERIYQLVKQIEKNREARKALINQEVAAA